MTDPGRGRHEQLPVHDLVAAGRILRRRQVVVVVVADLAPYLDLALRSGAALATFDGQLAGAMRAAGGTIFGEGTGEG